MMRSEPPWNELQVSSLNDYQTAGVMHPFTCLNRGEGGHPGGDEVLVAEPDGWVCPHCDYQQGWAHTWMADGSWRRLKTFDS